jgi:hypothetical protein
MPKLSKATLKEEKMLKKLSKAKIKAFWRAKLALAEYHGGDFYVNG